MGELTDEAWAHCANGHEWILGKLPMGLEAFAKQALRNAACPYCDAPGFWGLRKAPQSTVERAREEMGQTEPPAAKCAPSASGEATGAYREP